MQVRTKLRNKPNQTNPPPQYAWEYACREAATKMCNVVLYRYIISNCTPFSLHHKLYCTAIKSLSLELVVIKDCMDKPEEESCVGAFPYLIGT